MARRTVWRRQAEQDLSGVAVYIGDDDLCVAARFLDAVDAAILQLSDMPHLGRVREFQTESLRDLRSWAVKGFENYLLFYLPLDDGIEVIRLLHGARDLEAKFEDSEQ